MCPLCLQFLSLSLSQLLTLVVRISPPTQIEPANPPCQEESTTHCTVVLATPRHTLHHSPETMPFPSLCSHRSCALCDAYLRVASVNFSTERAEGIGLSRMEGGHTSLPVIHSGVEQPLASGRGSFRAFTELVFLSEM